MLSSLFLPFISVFQLQCQASLWVPTGPLLGHTVQAWPFCLALREGQQLLLHGCGLGGGQAAWGPAAVLLPVNCVVLNWLLGLSELRTMKVTDLLTWLV